MDGKNNHRGTMRPSSTFRPSSSSGGPSLSKKLQNSLLVRPSTTSGGSVVTDPDAAEPETTSTHRLPAIDVLGPPTQAPTSPIRHPLPQQAKQAFKNVRDAALVSKMSGTVNYTGFDAGVFVDRGQTMHPTVLCVRCAQHASLCMTCAEQQTSESLRFYRRSLGKGASAILNEAIKDAGLASMSKRIIFQLWRNSGRKYTAALKELYFNVGIAKDRKYVKPVFAAWKKYAKQEIIDRKNKKVEELKERLDVVARNMELLTEDKNNAVRNMVVLKDKLAASVAINDTYIAQIAKLESEVALERSRVLSLAALAAPLLRLTSLCAVHNQAEAAHYDAAITAIGRSTPAHNWASVFPESTREVVVRMAKKRVERESEKAVTGKASEKDAVSEFTEAMKILLGWVNHTSRLIYTIDRPTKDGDTFDSLLPRHEQIYELQQLKTGRTLARVVYALIHFGAEMEPAAPATASLRPQMSMKLVRKNSVIAPMDRLRVPKIRPLTDDQIAEMKNLEDDAEPLIELTLNLAVSYLGIPAFKFTDIHQGQQDSLFALVGCLMFSTHPLKEEAELQQVRAVLEEQARTVADVGVWHGRLTYATKAVRHIYSAVENYWSLDPEHVPYPPNDDDDEDEVPVVEAAAAATVAAAAPEPSTEGGDGGEDEGDATASGKTKELTEAERYAKVATAVDGLAASVETDMLREAVFEMADHVQRLKGLRRDVLKLQEDKDLGTRLATDVKAFALSVWVRQLIKPMQLVE